MPPLASTDILILPILLIAIYLIITVTTLLHESLHLTAVLLLGATIHGIQYNWPIYLPPNIRLSFNANTPRDYRIIALYPTIITTGILAYVLTYGTITGYIDLVIKTGLLALIGLPSRNDLQTAFYPPQ